MEASAAFSLSVESQASQHKDTISGALQGVADVRHRKFVILEFEVLDERDELWWASCQ